MSYTGVLYKIKRSLLFSVTYTGVFESICFRESAKLIISRVGSQILMSWDYMRNIYELSIAFIVLIPLIIGLSGLVEYAITIGEVATPLYISSFTPTM